MHAEARRRGKESEIESCGRRIHANKRIGAQSAPSNFSSHHTGLNGSKKLRVSAPPRESNGAEI